MSQKDFIPIQDPKLVRELEHKQKSIDALLKMTKAINSNYSTVKLFELYVDTLNEQFNYSNIIILYKTTTGWFVFENKQHQHLADLNLVQYMMPFKELTYLDKSEAMIGEYDTIVPVFHKENPLAYVMIEGVYNKVVDSVEEEVRFLETFTNIIIIAAENKRLFQQEVKQQYERKELKMAAEVQRALIPTAFPHHERCEFAAEYIPHSAIGGDSYDVIPHPTENALFVTVADVSGKGVSAAILMANFQAYLRAAIMDGANYDTFAEQINRQVNEITKGERFISLAVVKIEFDNNRVRYINFGHNPPILITGGELHQLDQGSTIIGAFDELPFINFGSVDLQGDSTLFAYTDGLSDILFQEEDGEQKLHHFLLQSQADSPDTINQQVMDMLDTSQLKSSDDITFITSRILQSEVA